MIKPNNTFSQVSYIDAESFKEESEWIVICLFFIRNMLPIGSRICNINGMELFLLLILITSINAASFFRKQLSMQTLHLCKFIEMSLGLMFCIFVMLYKA